MQGRCVGAERGKVPVRECEGLATLRRRESGGEWGAFVLALVCLGRLCCVGDMRGGSREEET